MRGDVKVWAGELPARDYLPEQNRNIFIKPGEFSE
jgi:hypothetical protein